MIKSSKQMFILIGVFALVMLVGTVTYAFFNYTRSGGVNTVRVGRISFNAVQGPAINLTDVFPIASSEVGTASNHVGSVTINVTGSTDYDGGIEYLISAVDVDDIIGTGYDIKSIPISIDVDYEANGNRKSIGTENANYFTVRGGNTSYYKVLSTSKIRNNGELVVGYIAPGQTGIDGNITITAYLDKDKIAVSDTYPENARRILNPNMTPDLVTSCVNYLTNMGISNMVYPGESLETFCDGTGTFRETTFNYSIENNFAAQAIQDMMNLNIIVVEYTDGTTDEWVNGRTVLTTTEWNSLQSEGLSFRVKVEANNGTWVNEPGKLESCPDCKFVYGDPLTLYTTSNTLGQTPSIVTSGLHDSYLDITEDMGKRLFLGLILNENNQITTAYACGIKGEMAYCVEGTQSGAKYTEKKAFLQSENLWNNTCGTYMRYAGTANQFESMFCTPSDTITTHFELHSHGCAIAQIRENGVMKTCQSEDNGRVSCS